MPARVRPRWGRIGAATSALAVTLVTLLGSVGALPAGASAAGARPGSASASGPGSGATLAAQHLLPASPEASSTGTVAGTGASTDPRVSRRVRTTGAPAVPAGSGSGKRVVFSISGQRVWLVDADGRPERSYLVSGSLTDNLRPGSYAVYSASRWATGVDDSGVMQYFVRFTRGQRAAIGFHSIPTKDGHALQTRDQLGTPQSHGCIRQWLPDAKALWDFAPVGTKVVVTA